MLLWVRVGQSPLLRLTVSELKDTEAAVGDSQVPQIDAEVVGREVCLAVAVDGDRVDMVGVSV